MEWCYWNRGRQVLSPPAPHSPCTSAESAAPAPAPARRRWRWRGCVGDRTRTRKKSRSLSRNHRPSTRELDKQNVENDDHENAEQDQVEKNEKTKNKTHARTSGTIGLCLVFSIMPGVVCYIHARLRLSLYIIHLYIHNIYLVHMIHTGGFTGIFFIGCSRFFFLSFL